MYVLTKVTDPFLLQWWAKDSASGGTIHDGILLVSTAQGSVGKDMTALVGVSLLNLVDAVKRELGNLPPERRCGALVVLDEMQPMSGVDYAPMLGELDKDRVTEDDIVSLVVHNCYVDTTVGKERVHAF